MRAPQQNSYSEQKFKILKEKLSTTQVTCKFKSSPKSISTANHNKNTFLIQFFTILHLVEILLKWVTTPCMIIQPQVG